MKMINFPDREFRIWYYSVSHSQLLIRSCKNANDKFNIDMLFNSVDYIELPSDTLNGLSICDVTDADMEYLNNKLQKRASANEITVLESGGKRFYVLSSALTVMENDLYRLALPLDMISYYTEWPENTNILLYKNKRGDV